jgi:hypothetical protein
MQTIVRQAADVCRAALNADIETFSDTLVVAA